MTVSTMAMGAFYMASVTRAAAHVDASTRNGPGDRVVRQKMEIR